MQQHEYQPDEVPLRSILKSNVHDFKQVKNIEGKVIKHQQHQERQTATSLGTICDQGPSQGELRFSDQPDGAVAPFKIKYPLSILKNSPQVQPAKFSNLKQIEGRIIPRLFLEEEEETGKIHFAGEIIIEPENAYKFHYNPSELPEGSIMKGSSHNPKRKSYDFSKLKNIDGKFIYSNHHCGQLEEGEQLPA